MKPRLPIKDPNKYTLIFHIRTVNKSLYSPSKTTRDVFVSISIIRGIWMLVQEGKVFPMDFSRHMNYCHILVQ